MTRRETTDSHRWPFWLAGLLVLVAALWVAFSEGHGPAERRSQAVLVTGALSAGGLALLAEWLGERRRQVGAWILVGLRAGALMVAVPELIALRSGLPMDEKLGAAPPQSECPIFYRMPSRLLDEIYLQREGNASWSGKPLTALLKWKRCTDEAYQDEQAFESRYDRDGFRNTDDLRDWDVVVSGDSQVELACLPEPNSITGVLAKRSGLRVKNLGAAGTGMVTQLAYLRHFGRAPSCRDAMIFLSEIDIPEIADEWQRSKSGAPPKRGLQSHSLLLACWHRAGQMLRADAGHSFVNASLRLADGRDQRVSFFPPVSHGSERMTAMEREALHAVLAEFAKAAQDLGLRPWLVLEPSAIRVWHDRLTWLPSAPAEVRNWQPNDAMEVLAQAAVEAGVHTIDLTPVLARATDPGLLFNPIVDKHFTKEGARLIAETLAQALKDPR